jgi:predicted hotdog family 3-hydroxylacyl-ACP dehydratase
MTGRQVHRSTARALAALMALIGVALMVEAMAGHGGVLSARTLLGALFLAAGLGRLYLEARRGSGT